MARILLFSRVQRTSPSRSSPDYLSTVKPYALTSVFPFHQQVVFGSSSLFPATTPTFESTPASSPCGPRRKDKPPSKLRLCLGSRRTSGGPRAKRSLL